jgi:hypothetical protein
MSYERASLGLTLIDDREFPKLAALLRRISCLPIHLTGWKLAAEADQATDTLRLHLSATTVDVHTGDLAPVNLTRHFPLRSLDRMEDDTLVTIVVDAFRQLLLHELDESLLLGGKPLHPPHPSFKPF